MSISDDLRANSVKYANFPENGDVACAIAEGFAALIDSMPNERERAELAALSGLCADGATDYPSEAAAVALAGRIATALLAQRQADAESESK